MYPFCKYSDGTEVVFSGIIKDENGEEFKDFADVDKSTLPIDIYWHE